MLILGLQNVLENYGQVIARLEGNDNIAGGV